MKKTSSKTASKKSAKAKTTARASAAKAEAQQSLKEIMTPNVEVVNPEDSLQVAARKMQERDIGFLPVCDQDRLIGTLSDRDITIRAVSAGRDPKSTTVREFTTPHTVWAYDDEDVKEAVNKMQEARVRRLMVLRRNDRKLVGVVSLGDLAANGTKRLSSEVLESTSPAVE